MRTTVPVWKTAAFLMLGWLTLAAQESTADDRGKHAAKKDAPADSADDFPFAPLPFRYRPLVQKGGDNILPAIEPRLAIFWGLGESAAIVAYDRSSCIRLLPKNDGGLRVAKIGVVSETLYVRIRLQVFRGCQARLDQRQPGPARLDCHDGRQHRRPGHFPHLPAAQDVSLAVVPAFLFTRANVHSIRMELEFNGTVGAV